MDDMGTPVLPAYAGMILVVTLLAGLGQRAPRIRGDDPGREESDYTIPKCSPHTRG